jgi:transcription elongation GreA/GreB family factor
MEPRKIPKFATEAEEARWWYDHRDEIAQDIIDASRAGRLGEGSRSRALRRTQETASASAEAMTSLKK